MEQRGILTAEPLEVEQNRLMKNMGIMGNIVDHSEERNEHPSWPMKTGSKKKSGHQRSVKKSKTLLEPKRNRSQEMPRLKSFTNSEGHQLSQSSACSLHSSLSKEASGHSRSRFTPKKAKSYTTSDSRPGASTTHKKDSTASVATVSSRSSTNENSVRKDQPSKRNVALRSRSQTEPHSEPITTASKTEKVKALSEKIPVKGSGAVEKKERSTGGLRKTSSGTGKEKTDYRSKFFPDLEFIPKRGTMTLPSLLSKTDEPLCFKTPESQAAKDDNRVGGKTSGRKIQVENRLLTLAEKSGKRESSNPTETTMGHIARSRIKSAQAVKSKDDSVYWKFASPETMMAYNDHVLNEHKPNNSLYLQILEEDNRMSAILQGDTRTTSEIGTKKSKPLRKSAHTSQTLSTEESQQPSVNIFSCLPGRSVSSSPDKGSSKVSNVSALKKQCGSSVDPKSSSKTLNHLSQASLEVPQKEIEQSKKTRTRKNDETSVQRKNSAAKNRFEPKHNVKTEVGGNCPSLQDSKKSSRQEDKTSLSVVEDDTDAFQNRKTKSDNCVFPLRKHQRIERVPGKSKSSSTGVQSAIAVTKGLEEDGKSRRKFFRKSNAVTEIAMNSESSPSEQQSNIFPRKKSVIRKQKEDSETASKPDSATSILKKSSNFFNVSESGRELPLDTLESSGKKKNRHRGISSATKTISSRENSSADRENVYEGVLKKNIDQAHHQPKRQLRTTSEPSHRNNDLNRSSIKDKLRRGDNIPTLSAVKDKSTTSDKSTPTSARLSEDSSQASAFSDSTLSEKRSLSEATQKKRRRKRSLTVSKYKSARHVSDNNDGAGQKSSTEEGENNAVELHPSNRNKPRKKSKTNLKQKSDWNNSLQEDPEADGAPESVNQMDDNEEYIGTTEDLEEFEGEDEAHSSSSSSGGTKESRRAPRRRMKIKTKPRKKVQQQQTASSKPGFSGWDIGKKLKPAAMDHIPTELELTQQLVERSVKLGWDQDRKSRFEKQENKFAPSVVTSFGPDEPQTYLAKHEIHALFQYMTAKLVKEQPDNPLGALIEYTHDLARHKGALKTANLPSSTCLEYPGQSQQLEKQKADETAKEGETAWNAAPTTATTDPSFICPVCDAVEGAFFQDVGKSEGAPGRYYLSQPMINNFDAQYACSILTGHLAEIDSEREFTLVKQSLEGRIVNLEFIHIGGKVNHQSNTITARDDEDRSLYAEWHNRQPSGTNDENCVTVYRRPGNTGIKMGSGNCTERIGRFLCEF